MDIYESAIEILTDELFLRDWPELQSIFERASLNSPRDWRLPVVSCEAVGGMHEQAVAAVASIACLQIAIILIDDMLDVDPRGEYQRLGMAPVANMASALQAAGMEIVAQSGAAWNAKLLALQSLNRMMLKTALGQYMDIQNPEDEAAYWEVVRTKSSPFFGAALNVGALLGGAAPDIAARIERFGCLYGEMIQIHDDLNDTMAVPANPDWTLDRSPLPILYAQTVQYADREKFLELRRALPDPEALKEAQIILIRCGAISYAVHQLILKHKLARELLKKTSSIDITGLEKLLDDVIQPVMKMFAAIGIAHPEIMLEPPIVHF